MLPHDTQQLLQAGSQGALQDAEAFVRRRVCADGSVDGEDGDFSGPERQWAALIEWAGSCGKTLPLDFPGPEREGGREHDVTLDEPTGRWIKYTKPSSSGYMVSWGPNGIPFLHNALPLDYLQRLLWQNEVFGDAVHLIGVWQALPHQWRIVTSQPGLQGHRATLDDLASAFVAQALPCSRGRALAMKAPLHFVSKASTSGTCIPPMSSFRPKDCPFPSTSSSPVLLF